MRLVTLFLFFILCSSKLIGQDIQNVDYFVYDDHVKVIYDLVNCPENRSYDVSVIFTKPDGSSIYPSSLKGDIVGVKPGTGKEILWYFKTDVDEYNGEIKAVVTISKVNDLTQPINKSTDAVVNPTIYPNESPNRYRSNVTAKGGADNFLLSMILPGLGGHFVNNRDKVSPYLITAAFLGVGYMAYSTMNSANDYFDKYLDTKSQVVMDEMYSKAIENRNQHQVYMGIAGAIWLYDVVHVIIKGSKNDKQRNFGGGVKLIPKYYRSQKSNPFELLLVKSF